MDHLTNQRLWISPTHNSSKQEAITRGPSLKKKHKVNPFCDPQIQGTMTQHVGYLGIQMFPHPKKLDECFQSPINPWTDSDQQCIYIIVAKIRWYLYTHSKKLFCIINTEWQVEILQYKKHIYQKQQKISSP